MLILGITTTLLMLYYAGYLWWSARHYSPVMKPRTDLRVAATLVNWEGVSVIVPARNEAENIGACVRDILAQQAVHSGFELIVVNDHSEDDTVRVATEAAAGDPRFRIIDLAEVQGVAYKKAAVAAGIRAAQGDFIVTTDADCRMGPYWLFGLTSRMNFNVGMVSGPVVLEGKRIFQQFQALEFMGLNAVGAAAIRAGRPTMCNGANLAYRKQVFEAVGGFSGIDHIASGDDELLMHKIARETDWKVAFALDRDAIVRTEALATWTAFKAQRRRWVSKSTQYKQASITATLVLSWLAMAGLPVLLVAAIWWPPAGIFLGVNLLLKMAGEFPILFRAAGFFDKLHLLRWFVPEQLAHIAYVLWVGLAGNVRSYTWKGREVK
ncbi:MAG: glycosyltransferase [Bacteroidota bacterium]